jgi:hypothetical protein
LQLIRLPIARKITHQPDQLTGLREVYARITRKRLHRAGSGPQRHGTVLCLVDVHRCAK